MKVFDYVAERKINSNKYNPIYTYDDLKGYWVRRSADLGYPLLTEAKYKRDRYIMNKEGMEKVFTDVAHEVLKQHETEIYAFYNNVISKSIKKNAEEVLNTMHLDSHGKFKANQPKPVEFSFFASLGRTLGMALARNIDYILDSMIHGKR